MDNSDTYAPSATAYRSLDCGTCRKETDARIQQLKEEADRKDERIDELLEGRDRRWWGRFKWTLAVLGALALTYEIGIRLYRSSAFGEEGARNATAQAERLVRTVCGPNHQLRVQCVDFWGWTGITNNCAISDISPRPLKGAPVVISCDTDRAGSNDGCAYKFGQSTSLENAVNRIKTLCPN